MNRLAAGRLVSVWGTKRHARVSFARLEPATPTQPDKARDFRHTVWTNKAGQSTAFKEQIHDQLTGAVMLPPGPARMQLSFTVGPRRNWLNLWKPAIDALDRVLGRTRPDRPWHPRDGRIVELGLHCSVDPALGNEVCISIAANAWL